MASAETRELIINTAAKLFAQFGFHGVSLRMIAKEAGIQASLAQYHFKNKESVFRAVFERCILPINNERLRRLDQSEVKRAQSEPVSLEDVVRAFIEPTVDVAHERNTSAAYYAALIAQITNDPQEHARKISQEFTDPIARHTLGVLRTLLPDVDQATLTWSYLFGVGAMLAAISRTGRAKLLSNGACNADDVEQITSVLIPFVAGGIQAAVEARRRWKRQRSARTRVG